MDNVDTQDFQLCRHLRYSWSRYEVSHYQVCINVASIRTSCRAVYLSEGKKPSPNITAASLIFFSRIPQPSHEGMITRLYDLAPLIAYVILVARVAKRLWFRGSARLILSLFTFKLNNPASLNDCVVCSVITHDLFLIVSSFICLLFDVVCFKLPNVVSPLMSWIQLLMKHLSLNIT